MTIHTSEVARLREQLALEEQASRWGLYGPAVVANHASNTVRMQQGAERILGLLRQGKREEADAILNSEFWEGEVVATPTSEKEVPPTP